MKRKVKRPFDNEQFRKGYVAGIFAAEKELNTELLHFAEKAHKIMSEGTFPDYGVKINFKDSNNTITTNLDMKTEEKAKAYDEALKVIKGNLDALNEITETGAETVNIQSIKNCFYKAFPELKESEESEDERIRKELLAVINDLVLPNEQRARFNAWLEKQKYDRMKPIYDARESFESALEKAWDDYHNGYENVDKLEDDYVKCAHAKGFREGYLFGIEKQKEQKPVEFDEYKIIKKHITEDMLSSEVNKRLTECGWYVTDEKPAEWTELTWKDVNDLEEIMNEVRSDYRGGGIGQKSFGLEVLERFRYMKGDELDVKEQKPAKWSEEDEEMLNSCISSIEESKENRYAYKENDGDTSYDREIAWLKSLRPQPKDRIYQATKHDLAIRFMNYLDENRPEGKMPLSEGECGDIDKAFKENDWAKIIQYVEKYQFQSEQKDEYKLTGWVARDNENNSYFGFGLFLFNEKPERTGDCWSGAITSHLPWKFFPDLKWEDEPMEVEVTIRKKNNTL